jgi:hypothetical protein
MIRSLAGALSDSCTAMLFLKSCSDLSFLGSWQCWGLRHLASRPTNISIECGPASRCERTEAARRGRRQTGRSIRPWRAISRQIARSESVSTSSSPATWLTGPPRSQSGRPWAARKARSALRAAEAPAGPRTAPCATTLVVAGRIVGGAGNRGGQAQRLRGDEIGADCRTKRISL